MKKKNAGKMCLSQYELLCASEGINVKFARQIESDDPNSDLSDLIDELKINFVYIGANAFTAPASEDNLVFSFFSKVKSYFTGTTAEYLSQNCKCRVIVVPEPDQVIHS